MSDPSRPGGPGSLGTATNSPVSDGGTNALRQHRPPVSHGMDDPHSLKLEDDYFKVGGAIVAFTVLKGARKALYYVRGDARGRELMDLWLSGSAAAEVTLDSAEWGDYMRAAPELPKQIRDQLTKDSNAICLPLGDGPFRKTSPYQASFHGEVGTTAPLGGQISGGYFTGYEILHGSKKTDTLNDVEIFGQYTAVRPQKGAACSVTFENLRFIWNDIIKLNAGYGPDTLGVRYARNENYFTGRAPPRDYVVHIKWESQQPITIELKTSLPVFPNQ